MYIYGISSGSEGVGLFLSYQSFMRYVLKHLFDIYMSTLVVYNSFANDLYLDLYMFDVD